MTNQKSSKEVSLLLSENNAKVASTCRLKLFSHEWEKITSDCHILDAINHYMIEFSDIPRQPHTIHETILTEWEMPVMEAEIMKLLDRGVIVECQHDKGEYTFTVFPSPKKDGKFRMILNLKSMVSESCDTLAHKSGNSVLPRSCG